MNDSFSKMTFSERVVAEYLQHLNIRWSYEQPLFVWDRDGRPRVWAPDFYLVQFGIYLEVCGSGLVDYSYRKKVFEENGYPVIFLKTYKSAPHWQTFLMHSLEFYVSLHYRNLAKVKLKK